MKEKRKTRLNKTQGTKTEFLGFGAFADTTTAPGESQQPQQPQTKAQTASLRWSPIYAGKDEALALLFPRLLKKDTTTRSKALQELQEYFQQDDKAKKQQVDALAHFLFLYHSKLTYDSSSSVRAEALVVLALAAARVPKAFSALIQQNNRQVLGMMYCCHGDPAAEVRAVATKYVQGDDGDDKSAAYTLTDMQAGIWDYVERILSYGRASKMQEDLFATSLKGNTNSGNSGKGRNNSNDSSAKSGELNEAQKDQLEEIFERVVGTALSGLQVWIQQYGLVDGDDDDGLCQRLTTLPSPVLWKTLSCSKPSLRNRTYALLSTCCQKAPAIIFDPPGGNGFSQTLPQALASEKEPGNIASLLEALLAYLAACSQHTGSSPWASALNVGTATKHMIKIFKKSCYGASVTQWGPSLLPLLAMLPGLSDQVDVLTAVWKGRDSAIRVGDQMTVVRTVSESAAFFLLRRGKEENTAPMEFNGERNHAKELAELWLDCFKNFLDTDLLDKPKSSSAARSATSRGPVRQARAALGKALASEMQQLETACNDRPTCAIYTVSDWFWQEQLRSCILEAEGFAALATIVQEMTPSKSESASASSSDASQSRLSSILQEKFSKVLSAFQNRSGDVPTVDAYDLMSAILQVCGIDDGVEQESQSIEKFLMNDVLRWMVIHTSSLSTQEQTKGLAQKDFRLFGIGLAVLPSVALRGRHWEAALREVIAAKCRLRLLLVGLMAMLQSGIPVDQVQCDILDEFAVGVVKDAMVKGVETTGPDIEGQEEEHDNTADLTEFLQTCAGIKGCPALVRRSVLASWIDQACPNINFDNPQRVPNVPGPILETLLLLLSVPSSVSTPDIIRIAGQSWRQGGREWEQLAQKLLLNEPSHLSHVIDQSSKILRAMLVDMSSKAGDSEANKEVKLWSDMARRLLQLSKRALSNDMKVPPASLDLISLGDISLWESLSRHDFLFCCLMRILGETAGPSERLQLLQSCGDDDGVGFIVQLLLSLSEASATGIGASRSKQRKDRCAQLLAVLGGRTILGRTTSECWLKATISKIVQYIQAQDMGGTRRGVALASQLCDLMVDRVTQCDVFSPDEDGEDVGEEFERERIARIVVPALTKESFASLSWSSCVAELVNVVFSQCGVGPERGIGSLHYDMFQLVLSSVGRLRACLRNPGDAREEDVCQELMLLSLSCGLGLNTPEPESNLKLITFDVDKITASVLDYHETLSQGEDVSDLDRAVLSWLIASNNALKDGDLRSRALTCLYKGAISILSSSVGTDKDTLLALRSIHVAMVASREFGPDVANLGVQAVMRVVEGFSLKWANSVEQRGNIGQDFDESCQPILRRDPAWRSLSHFPEILAFMVSDDHNLLKATCSEFVDDLVKALFVESKRWFAFRLLEAIARSTQVIGDATPDKATAQRLAEWTANMDAEEKEEMEEDLEITCEILPHRLMTEMESWSDEEYTDSVDDEIIIGRMLAWLSCLCFVDAFVRKDPSYRPSLCSYIDKNGAAEAILNQTLLHTGVGTERTSQTDSTVDMDMLLKTEGTVGKRNLASLVLFRTVEALPTLSRKWWETDCPKVYIGPIRDYIETQIAPVILSRELERLKVATNKNVFGGMTVTGSVTTREITAIYIQDEIKLKVMIRLPSFFPLRNAEVDCSQTLGISAKRWKLWSLQITMMLNNQGGTLQEALMLWKENVDKEFTGVEPCPVCYSVLHIKTHKLPELECTTCSNRFHTQCLTEWFRKSGKTQCVLCQQPWAGTRVKK